MDPYKWLRSTDNNSTYLNIIPGDILRLIADHLHAIYIFHSSLVYDGTWRRDINMGLSGGRRLVSGHGGLHVESPSGTTAVADLILNVCGKYTAERGRWVTFGITQNDASAGPVRAVKEVKHVHSWLGEHLYDVSNATVSRNAIVAYNIGISPHIARSIIGNDIDQTYAFSSGYAGYGIPPIIYEHMTGKLVANVSANVSSLSVIVRFGEWFAFGDYDMPFYRVTLVDMQGRSVFVSNIPNYYNRGCRMIVSDGGLFVIVGETVHLVEVIGVERYS